MPSRLSLCTAALLLLSGCLALTTFRHGNISDFVLEVPATYLSVGQQFQPRLVARDPLGDGAGSDAALDGTLDLLDASGQRVSSEPLEALQAGSSTPPSPLDLPRAGRYLLRIGGSGGAVQTVPLDALPEPAASYGGVVSLASVGLAPGIVDYLRQHSFAVTPLTASDASTAARMYIVGDPRLATEPGDQVVADYAQLWRQVADGAQALLLQPPSPGVAELWPVAPPVQAAAAACGADLFADPLLSGLTSDAALATLLHPALAYDLTQASQFDLYHWDGVRLARPNRHVGYAGCQPLFSYRYGEGWVTLSTVPLLQHFQDARARLYFMNLIKALMRRRRYAPASPGLQWVTEHRFQPWAQSPPSVLALSQAVFYRPPPAALEPAPVLVPQAADSDPNSCWRAPASPQLGATLVLDLARPQAARSLTLGFALAPSALQLAASADGVHWSALAAPAVAKQTLALPAGTWRAFRLTLANSPAGLRLCQFSTAN